MTFEDLIAVVDLHTTYVNIRHAAYCIQGGHPGGLYVRVKIVSMLMWGHLMANTFWLRIDEIDE